MSTQIPRERFCRGESCLLRKLTAGDMDRITILSLYSTRQDPIDIAAKHCPVLADQIYGSLIGQQNTYSRHRFDE
jgi:hypothetical protein